MPLYALVLSVIGFLPLSLLALQLSDLAGARIIQEFLGGQSGVYALDCRRPISGDNPHQLFADYLFAGQPVGMIVGTRRSLSDAGSLTGYVSQVEIHKDSGRLGYFVQTMDDRYSFVWQKEGEEAIRLYSLLDETTHVRFVTNGIFANTAMATPLYLHCPFSLFSPDQGE